MDRYGNYLYYGGETCNSVLDLWYNSPMFQVIKIVIPIVIVVLIIMNWKRITGFFKSIKSDDISKEAVIESDVLI